MNSDDRPQDHAERELHSLMAEQLLTDYRAGPASWQSHDVELLLSSLLMMHLFSP